MEVLFVFLFSGINIAMTEIYFLSVMLSALFFSHLSKYKYKNSILDVISFTLFPPVCGIPLE